MTRKNEKIPYIYAIQTEDGLKFDYEYEYGDLVVNTLPIHLVDRRLDKELISFIEFAYREGVEAGISIGRNKKYYLRLKKAYAEFFIKNRYCTYINYDKEKNEYFISDEASIKNYKTQFTEKEIEEIELPSPLTIDMFYKVEVGG